jgi:hypothetical protein
MLEIVQSDRFTFVIHGSEFPSTVAEAVLFSSKVYDSLRSDVGSREFTISDETIDPALFGAFIQFARSRDCPDLPREQAICFLSLCRILGNEALATALLASLALASAEAVSLRDCSIDYCACNFSNFSVEQLRSLDKSMLHNVLNSPSLRLNSEDDLLEMFIELGSEYEEFWSYIVVDHLSTDGALRFFSELPFDNVTADIWDQVAERLKATSRVETPIDRSEFPSSIIHEIPEILSEFRKSPWILLYRGSQHGYRANSFHETCDGRMNTLTLILTPQGAIFGGFTPLAWDSTSGYKSDPNKSGFLFTLKNPHAITPMKFPMVNTENAIWCNRSFGPVFGAGWDLMISDDCHAKRHSYVTIGTTYENPTQIDGRKVLTGDHNFVVQEIEVFTIDLTLN